VSGLQDRKAFPEYREIQEIQDLSGLQDRRVRKACKALPEIPDRKEILGHREIPAHPDSRARKE
jgi:hypothetical protein